MSTLRDARLTPSEVLCCECAANGAALGDPIEFGSLQKVHTSQLRKDPLVLLSAKSVKGHTEGASGLTGLMKCIILLDSGDATPILHMGQLNGTISTDEADILFPNETVELFCDDELKVG